MASRRQFSSLTYIQRALERTGKLPNYLQVPVLDVEAILGAALQGSSRLSDSWHSNLHDYASASVFHHDSHEGSRSLQLCGYKLAF